MRVVRLALLLVLLSRYGFSQSVTTGALVRFPEIGLQYTPPAGLHDSTAVDKETVRQQAEARHTTNVFDVLLAVQSTSGDATKDWQRIGIQTYPREKLSSSSDAEAMRKVSRWVAGPGADAAEPKQADIGGFHFLISTLQLQEGGLMRHGRVYITISRGRIVILSFTANSDEVLSRSETSVNSITAIPQK